MNIKLNKKLKIKNKKKILSKLPKIQNRFM